MSWVAVAIAGSAVIGAVSSNAAADKSADATRDANAAAISEQRRQFDLSRQDLAPYREAGYGALERLRRLSEGDFSDFYESPGYNFRLREGQKAIDRSLAARGMALSGAGVKEGIRYGQGLASDEFGNYWNRLSGLAGTGQTATNTGAMLGANMAGNIGNYMANTGSARANAYMAAGQGINNAVQGGLSNYMLYNYLNPSQTSTAGTSYYQPDNSGFVYNL